MTTDAAAGQLRALVRAALTATSTTQTALAAGLGMSQKHVSRVLGGHDNLSASLADRMLRAVGWQLVISMRPAPAGPDDSPVPR